MNLVRMIYVSAIADRTDSEAIQKILTTAKKNNDKHDLTGLLVFNSKYYLQAIEGGREPVNVLLGNLFTDQRHTGMLVLGLEQIHQRVFSSWSMEFKEASSASRQIMLRNGSSRIFSPYEMTYQSALSFLSDVATLHQQQK